MMYFIVFVRRVISPIYSFFINFLYWIYNFRDLRKTINLKKETQFESVNEVKEYMSTFVWKEDSFFDWTPWVITILHRGKTDDCDGASVLGKWALQKLGITSIIISLWDSKNIWTGHSICLATNPKTTTETVILITNDRLVYLGDDIERTIASYFDYKYDMTLYGWEITKLKKREER